MLDFVIEGLIVWFDGVFVWFRIGCIVGCIIGIGKFWFLLYILFVDLVIVIVEGLLEDEVIFGICVDVWEVIIVFFVGGLV